MRRCCRSSSPAASPARCTAGGCGPDFSYKTSGIFNFADGALASIAAYIFCEMFVQSEWSWQVSGRGRRASVIAPLLGCPLELMARREVLRHAAPAYADKTNVTATSSPESRHERRWVVASPA